MSMGATAAAARARDATRLEPAGMFFLYIEFISLHFLFLGSLSVSKWQWERQQKQQRLETCHLELLVCFFLFFILFFITTLRIETAMTAAYKMKFTLLFCQHITKTLITKSEIKQQKLKYFIVPDSDKRAWASAGQH